MNDVTYNDRDSTLIKVVLYVSLYLVISTIFMSAFVLFLILVYFYEIEYKNLTMLKEKDYKTYKKSTKGVLESFDNGLVELEELERTLTHYKELRRTKNLGKLIKMEKYNKVIKDMKYTDKYRPYKEKILYHIRKVSIIPYRDIVSIYRDKHKLSEHIILFIMAISGTIFTLIFLFLDINFPSTLLVLETKAEVTKLMITHIIFFFLTVLHIVNVKYILADKYLERRQDEILKSMLNDIIDQYQNRINVNK